MIKITEGRNSHAFSTFKVMKEKQAEKISHHRFDESSSFPELKQNEIHLWRISLKPSDEILKKCEHALSGIEQQRLDFFSFANVRQNYLVSQGTMRLLLGKYLKIKPNEIKIGRHRKGKPYSLDDPSVYFNNSNSGDYCVYAFTKTGEVGIDLEQIRPLNDLNELIDKNLKTNEQRLLGKSPDKRLRDFFRFWTFKESYLKAIGEGMRIEPHRLEFTLNRNSVQFVGINGFDDTIKWQFKEIPFGYYIRTLTHMPNEKIEVQDFEIV